jgi:hypothetical protein
MPERLLDRNHDDGRRPLALNDETASRRRIGVIEAGEDPVR